MRIVRICEIAFASILGIHLQRSRNHALVRHPATAANVLPIPTAWGYGALTLDAIDLILIRPLASQANRDSDGLSQLNRTSSRIQPPGLHDDVLGSRIRRYNRKSRAAWFHRHPSRST